MSLRISLLFLFALTFATLAADPALVFISERHDDNGLPLNVLEAINADGSGRVVLCDPEKSPNEDGVHSPDRKSVV